MARLIVQLTIASQATTVNINKHGSLQVAVICEARVNRTPTVEAGRHIIAHRQVRQVGYSRFNDDAALYAYGPGLQ